VVDFWDFEIADKKIDLIINAFSAAVVAIARSYNIATRNIFEGRHEALYHWAFDEKETNPIIEDAYNRLDGDFEGPNLAKPPQSQVFLGKYLLEDFLSFRGLAKAIYRIVREHAYYTYKGRKYGRYLLLSNVQYTARWWRVTRRLHKHRWKALSDLGDKPFVFFPLHVEPEIAIQTKSPEFLVQLSAIISLSKSLPAGKLLVVKDHLTALGRRPSDFYGQISELKNVVLLDVFEPGIDVIKKAAVIATISGTAGFEGATIGKPVITFGRHNIYSFLPHVFELTDDVQLKSYLEKALGANFDAAKARADGAKFLAAMKEVSFDMTGYNRVLAEGYSNDSVKSAVDALEQSLLPSEESSISSADVNEDRRAVAAGVCR